MATIWRVVEDHQFYWSGTVFCESRIVAMCESKALALQSIAMAFDQRWNEHLLPADFWVSECYPPEEIPDAPWFSSKFPDEGEYRFHVENYGH